MEAGSASESLVIALHRRVFVGYHQDMVCLEAAAKIKNQGQRTDVVMLEC